MSFTDWALTVAAFAALLAAYLLDRRTTRLMRQSGLRHAELSEELRGRYEAVNARLDRVWEQLEGLDGHLTPPAEALTTQPSPAVIEIVERNRVVGQARSNGIIIPDDIRINGQPLLSSAEQPVIVHEITSRADEPTMVTLTLFARRVAIAAEGDL